MKFIALAILLSSQVSLATSNLFNCEFSHDEEKVSMSVDAVGTKIEGRLNRGGGDTLHSVYMTVLAPDLAQNNSYAYQLANLVNLDWNLVTMVEIFEVGNYEDDAAGAIGINFLDEGGNVYKKAMFFGWGGALTCD